MMVMFSEALLIAPAKRMAGGMGRQQSVMMEVRTWSPLTLPSAGGLHPGECMATRIVFMSPQRDTVPTRVFLLGQGRWVANTALKTLLLTTVAGDLSCVAPSSEGAKKVAHGVGQSLPAKVTLDPRSALALLAPH